MLKRLPALFVPVALIVTGCVTSPSQTNVSDGIAPLGTVTPEDARALSKRRQERRELAKILLDRAEERSKTQQPSMWRPLGILNPEDVSVPPLQPVKILEQPWKALKRTLAPAATPSSSTTPISQ